MTELFTSGDIEPAEEDRGNRKLERFCATVEAFWSARTKQADGKDFILVDLMVRHTAYSLGNILVAKYLQRIEGGRLLGIVPSADQLSYRTARIAESFGFEGFISEPDGARPLSRHAGLPALLQSLEGLTPEALRERLLGISITGLRVGHLIYDSYMRWTRNGTIAELDSALKVHVAQVFEYLEFHSELLDRYPTKAVVMGHMGYIRFGTLTRLALQRGIPVYNRIFNGPTSITRFDDLADVDTDVVRYSGGELDKLYGKFSAQGIPAAREYMRKRVMPDHESTGLEFTAPAHGPATISLDPAALSARLGLDPAKPSAAIYGHVLTDSPHLNNWMIYDDYYRWFVETLDIVKDITEINWIVRLHPSRIYYDEASERDLCQVTLDAAKDRYPHIFGMPITYSSNSLFKLVSVVTTACGTAGYEFPAIGVPSIVAGETRYSGNGFTIEPKNAEEYRAALKSVPHLEPLSEAQIERALFFCYVYYFHSRRDSPFLTYIAHGHWAEFDEGEVWHNLEAAMARNEPDEDPLFIAFEQQVTTNRRFLGGPPT